MLHNSIFKVMSVVFMLLLLSSCIHGDDDGGDTGAGNNTAPIGDLTGSWSVTENVDATACGDGTYIDNYMLNATQSGNSITVNTNTGNYTGRISGDSLTWNGSYPEAGGTTQTSVSLTVNASCNEISGTAVWTWTDGAITCSGTTQVSAIRSNQIGCGTNTTSAPRAPGSLIATAVSASSISLSWSDNSSNEEHFIVQRSSTSGSGFTTIITLAADTTSYTNSGLIASTTYYYRVYSTNSIGNSSNSNEVNATTTVSSISAPSAPSNIFSYSVNITSAQLSWTDNSNNETGFIVERSTSSTGPFTQIETLAENTIGYEFTSLTAGTRYYFRVRAYNGGGNSYSNIEAIRTADAAPVTSVPVSVNLNVDFSISWTYSYNSGGLASTSDGFIIQRSATSPTSGFVTVDTVVRSSRSITDNLSIAGTYYYRVYARGYSFTSNMSNVVAVTVGNSVVTTTYTVTLDNLLMSSSTNNAMRNTVYSISENSVGCNWVYSSITFIQDYVCAISLLYFAVDADINGKTIISADLKLYPEILPASYTKYQVWAVFEPWNSNVTWAILPLIHTGSAVVFNQPTSSLPSVINVTNIVQNWANGLYTNNGFLIEDVDIVPPYANSLRGTVYCSKEGIPACTRQPELVVTYR
ncbi:MAG: fibronectin type III domain-containing protein [Candidatus Heimdallarchaeota archaeon]